MTRVPLGSVVVVVVGGSVVVVVVGGSVVVVVVGATTDVVVSIALSGTVEAGAASLPQRENATMPAKTPPPRTTSALNRDEDTETTG